MAEVSNEEVLARLEKVERENRMLKRFVLAAFVPFVALFAMGQAPNRPRTIEAERLVIRYPNGKEGIVLDTKGSLGIPGAGIHMNSPDNKIQMDLEAGGQGPDEFAAMGITLRTYPIFNLDVNTRGEVRETFYSFSNYGSPFPLGPVGGPMLQLLNGPTGPAVRLIDSGDNGRKVRAALGSTELETISTGSKELRPLSSLVFFDKEGKVLWRAP